MHISTKVAEGLVTDPRQARKGVFLNKEGLSKLIPLASIIDFILCATENKENKSTNDQTKVTNPDQQRLVL